ARVLVADAFLPRPGARSTPLTFEFLERLGRVLWEAQQARQLDADAFPVELALHAFTLYVGGVLTVVNGYGGAHDAQRTLRGALDTPLRGAPPPRPSPYSKRRKP